MALMLLALAPRPEASTLQPAPARIEAATRVVDRSECFPDYELTDADRARSEDLLRQMLDGEGLYTLVGGLKPVSGRNLFKLSFIPDYPDTPTAQFVAAAADLQRLVSVWRCGPDLGAYVFADPRRASLSDTYLYNLPAYRRTITAHGAYFTRLGLTPAAHPAEAIIAIRQGEESNRGMGYLFGYPDYAVDWYEDVHVPELKARGEWPDGDVVEIPTFEKMVWKRTNTEHFRFSWAVPKGHVENDADRAIRATAARIFSAYTARRARYIGPGKPGAFALLRNWFCGEDARCDPARAISIPPIPKE